MRVLPNSYLFTTLQISFLFLFGATTTTTLVGGFVLPSSLRLGGISQHLPLSQRNVDFLHQNSLMAISAKKDDGSSSSGTTSIGLGESDQGVLGGAGTLAALITFYSEFTLKQTGCGLPAGPFGLVGLVEGLSYLGVTGIVAFSIVKKVKSGSGLPAGPGGLLGLAEGLSFLAIVGGLVVLGFQLTDYGYVPNAVPMEGGMCS